MMLRGGISVAHEYITCSSSMKSMELVTHRTTLPFQVSSSTFSHLISSYCINYSLVWYDKVPAVCLFRPTCVPAGNVSALKSLWTEWKWNQTKHTLAWSFSLPKRLPFRGKLLQNALSTISLRDLRHHKTALPYMPFSKINSSCL